MMSTRTLKSTDDCDFDGNNHHINYINTTKPTTTTSHVQQYDSIWIKLQKQFGQCLTDVGNVSLLITLCIGLVGVVIIVMPSEGSSSTAAAGFFLSCGIFGFSAGITNYIAIQMIFIKIPLLYGSGVIQSQYDETKRLVRKLMMDAFLSESLITSLANSLQTLSGPVEGSRIDAVLDEKMMELERDGELLNGTGLDKSATRMLLKTILYGLRDDMILNIRDSFQETHKDINLGKLQFLMVGIIDTRMQVLTEKKMADIVQSAIKQHLGWIVFWGSFIGGLIGLICQGAGVAPNY